MKRDPFNLEKQSKFGQTILKEEKERSVFEMRKICYRAKGV